MSYDFDTSLAPCEHMVRRERMSLDTDHQTLVYYYNNAYYMRGTINGEDSVKVYINGIQIPPNHPEWGWYVMIDPNTRDASFAEKRKRIRFKTPHKLVSALFEVDYRTIAAHCRRCQGSGKASDFKLSQTNSFIKIRDMSKLMLKVSKFLLTSKCEFYPAFTAPLRDWIGDKITFSMAEEDVALAISASLSNLKRVQMTQKNYQDLSPLEILRELGGVDVYSDPDEPSRLIAKVFIISYGSSDPAPLTFTMRNDA